MYKAFNCVPEILSSPSGLTAALAPLTSPAVFCSVALLAIPYAFKAMKLYWLIGFSYVERRVFEPFEYCTFHLRCLVW